MNKKMGFEAFAQKTRPELKKELLNVVAQGGDFGCSELLDMITYQLGWTGDGAGPKAEGKRIRPLLVMLAAEGAGGNWRDALPAAAAVELIHNFSLIHDDIEDQGETRRGRPTIWKLWGEAQAINTGDAMFALANISMHNLNRTISSPAAQEACSLFHSTCLRLTQGQHLDILFEDREVVSLDEYWEMVSGKTAALLAFCLEVGAISAGVTPNVKNSYREFGHNLGLAFQVQDDILGIWGETDQIGKSNTGDLIEKKKTLPVIYGLEQKKGFYQRWTAGPILPGDVQDLRVMLEEEGGLAYAQKHASQLTSLALTALKHAAPKKEFGQDLIELAETLLGRNK
jgi:geranylgeranyl diphosphate synthase type I